jgi:sec-independent protein translocase protein TatB
LFDVAFSELVVIVIVALIVIGPEKLPKVARTLGSIVGRMQRYMVSVKADIEREMQFEDLQKLQQEIKQGVEQSQTAVTTEVESEARAIQRTTGGANTIKKPAGPHR